MQYGHNVTITVTIIFFFSQFSYTTRLSYIRKKDLEHFLLLAVGLINTYNRERSNETMEDGGDGWDSSTQTDIIGNELVKYGVELMSNCIRITGTCMTWKETV